MNRIKTNQYKSKRNKSSNLFHLLVINIPAKKHPIQRKNVHFLDTTLLETCSPPLFFMCISKYLSKHRIRQDTPTWVMSFLEARNLKFPEFDAILGQETSKRFCFWRQRKRLHPSSIPSTLFLASVCMYMCGECRTLCREGTWSTSEREERLTDSSLILNLRRKVYFGKYIDPIYWGHDNLHPWKYQDVKKLFKASSSRI